MIPPYFASSMIVSLRLSGHLPDILISDFKDRNSMSIKETLKNYLDEQYIEYGNLTEIPTGRLAYIVQAVIAICENPTNFYGYNLYNPLRFGIERFGASPTFNNYFQYSLAVIALCNGGIKVSKRTVHELINGANGRRNIHFVDTSALILIALSCAKKSYRSYQAYRASRKLIVQIIFKQNASTGAFGNQYSTALAVEVSYTTTNCLTNYSLVTYNSKGLFL